jgi:hypothetical protein
MKVSTLRDFDQVCLGIVSPSHPLASIFSKFDHLIAPTTVNVRLSRIGVSMTLVAAWVRRNSNLHELVVASDSRLGGGESWDACPKIVQLPRPATVMAMSGDATEAYAFLLQAINTCSLLDGNKTGRTDLGYLARKLRDVYADIRSHVSDLPAGQTVADVPDLQVGLYGWSWRNLAFEGYSYSYDDVGNLRMHSCGELAYNRAYPLHLMGDGGEGAWRRIGALKEARGLPLPMRRDPEASKIAEAAFFNWEPLEVIVEMSQDISVRTVGGFPQVFRIYQYGEAEPFVWRTEDDVDYFGGRPVQAEERFDRRIIRLKDGNAATSFSDKSIYYSSEPTASPPSE